MKVIEIPSQIPDSRRLIHDAADWQTLNSPRKPPISASANEKITVKVFDNESAFTDLREDWQNLFAQTDAAPFLSWEWSAAWFKFFGNNRRPFILAAYCGAKLTALLPLCFEKKRIAGMSFGKLTFIGAEIGGAAYLDALMLPAERIEITRSFREFFTTRRDFDVLEIAGIAKDSAFLQDLSENFDRENFRLNLVPYDVCQFAEVCDKSSADELLARIYNDTAKKKLKRLKKLENFEFRRITAPDQTSPAFERFTRLHDGNWTEKGGSDVTGNNYLLDFHRSAVDACAAGNTVFFDELWVENKCIAALYGFMRDEIYFYYSSGFDADYFKFSPMATLYNLSIENGINNGIKIFDFLCGGQAYKTQWTNDKNELLTARLSRKTTATFFSENFTRIKISARDFTRQILPADVLEKLKSIRRRRKRKALPTTS